MFRSFQNLVSAMLLVISFNLFSQEEVLPNYLTFNSLESIHAIQNGSIVSTLRTKDRTIAPYTYTVGSTAHIVCSNKKIDSRTFKEQIEAKTYGKVKINKILVSNFDALNDMQKAEVLKFFTQEEIDAAKSIITSFEFNFVK